MEWALTAGVLGLSVLALLVYIIIKLAKDAARREVERRAEAKAREVEGEFSKRTKARDLDDLLRRIRMRRQRATGSGGSTALPGADGGDAGDGE